MKYADIPPSELIGMVDYPPLHSPEALARYYELFKHGGDVHQPVAPIAVVIQFFVAHPMKYAPFKERLEEFLGSHEAKYFMFGGKHRGAAAVIAGRPVPCVITENEKDVAEVFRLRDAGLVPQSLGLGESMQEALTLLLDHFSKHALFWTMEEKVKAMIANGDVPGYMLTAQ